MTPSELASTIRSRFGSEGYIVYDRRDRWRDEHAACLSKHTRRMDGSVAVDICPDTTSVLIVANEPLGVSKCGRCLSSITTEELERYLAAGYLCGKCEGETDDDFFERVKAAEKQYRGPTYQ